jgi:hypothetical protein
MIALAVVLVLSLAAIGCSVFAPAFSQDIQLVYQGF